MLLAIRGVPIPVFYDKETREPLMTQETLSFIESVFKEKGSDSWWELSVEELLPPTLRQQAHRYDKGTDTMDVWFDSGTSWAGVVQNREELQYPADIYLEGSDQHRGWFQSSLLTSVAARGTAPYKKVLTHGFVLDEKGYKMSKSLGNVVDPKDVIEGGSNQKEKPAYGADTLRLWVSSVDYSGDVCVGDNIMKQMSDSYRKLRNTLRFLAGSLNDYNPTTDAVPYDELADIDKYMLGLLSETVSEVEKSYNEYQFFRANQAINQFCNTDLSAFYLDISKDRLYISSLSDKRRKSCQTVLFMMMEQLAIILSPILPHLSEDLWQNFPILTSMHKSVFQRGWIKSNEIFNNRDAYMQNKEKWNTIRTIRDDVNRCMETARQAKYLGASQEVQVMIGSNDASNPILSMLKDMEGDKRIFSTPKSTNGIDDLRFIFISSQVTVHNSIDDIVKDCPYVLTSNDSDSGLTIGVSKSLGKKCERCWYYCESVGDTAHDHDADHHSDLCSRCNQVIQTDGYKIESSVLTN